MDLGVGIRKEIDAVVYLVSKLGINKTYYNDRFVKEEVIHAQRQLRTGLCCVLAARAEVHCTNIFDL